LVLPSLNRSLEFPRGEILERRTDGSVPFVIENAPPEFAELRDRVVRLRWDAPWRHRVTTDVTFTFIAEQARLRGGVMLPKRVDGWSLVSPLESLAASLPTDTMQVRLEDVRVTNDGYGDPLLVIQTPPTRILGREVALARFLVTSQGSRLAKVRHYSQTLTGFWGAEEDVLVPAFAPPMGGRAPATTLERFERSPENREGWYLYGHRGSDGVFVVDAIEPRSSRLLSTTRTIADRDAVTSFIGGGIYAEQSARIGFVDRIALGRSDLSTVFEGERLLAVHANVMATGPRGRWPQQLPITSGHVSFGIATVVRDEFTGELLLDMVYQQIYCHNPDPQFASRVARHVFVGAVEFGFLNGNTIMDAVVRWPEGNVPLVSDDVKSTFLERLSDRVEQMLALYRTGHGTGLTLITTGTSCSEDSAAAMYAAIEDTQAACARESTPGCAILDKLLALKKDISRSGNVPERWRLFSENPALLVKQPSTRHDTYDNVRNVLRNLNMPFKQLGTLLPADVYFLMLNGFLNQGLEMVITRSVFVGGDASGIVPLNPMQVLSKR
jgi:predicted Abi (CAAX) family protease